MSVPLENAVIFVCPLCEENIPVTFHVTQSPDEGYPASFMLAITPDITGVHLHGFEKHGDLL